MAETQYLDSRMALLNKRLEALKLGKYTDCSFLVGPEDADAKEVHAVKSIMMMGSEFMEGLFNSPLPLPNPVRINNVEPHIFELVVEFLHLTEFNSNVDCMDVVELAIAADHLLIETLKSHCKALIESKVTVENIWPVLNRVLEFGMEDVAQACNQVLCDDTRACVESSEFLRASSASLNHMLSLDVLSITSEIHLIDICWKWAQHQEDERDAMRSLLTGLRFLTLTPVDAANLPDFLTDKEKAAIMEYCITKNKKSDIPATLCATTAQREYILMEMTQLIALATNGEESACEDLAKFSDYYAISNKIEFRPLQDLYITGLSCFGVILEGCVNPGIKFNPLKNSYEKIETKTSAFNCTVTLRGLGNKDETWDLTNLPSNTPWAVKLREPVLLKKNIEYSANLLYHPRSCNYYFLNKRNEDDVNSSLQNLLHPRVFSSFNVTWSSDYHTQNRNGLNGPIFLHNISYVIKK
ncbi:uncharacterized protein LOC135944164 [Cloeon dipterum]|uniref:uncharacterized protein LOC135944164 n=1 Tax=Cloeon dipterum TaxID=197152 RepID=UPI00321FDAFF